MRVCLQSSNRENQHGTKYKKSLVQMCFWKPSTWTDRNSVIWCLTMSRRERGSMPLRIPLYTKKYIGKSLNAFYKAIRS